MDHNGIIQTSISGLFPRPLLPSPVSFRKKKKICWEEEVMVEMVLSGFSTIVLK